MVAVANKSSRDTSRRVARAARTRAENGGHHGGRRPFGYDADGVTLRPDEADEVRRAADALLSGRSLRSIVADLRERDVRTVTGCQWSSNALRDVLLRPRNAGIATHRGEPVGRGAWEPLFDEETHRAVIALLNDPARRTSPGNAVRWLGSGLYRCGLCGAPMRCTRSGGNRAPSYRCTESAHLIRDAASLDRAVVAALLNRLDDAKAIPTSRPTSNGPDPAEVARAVARLEARLGQLKTALLDPDADDLDDLRAAMRILRERIAAEQATLLARAEPDPLAEFADAPDATAVWVRLDLDRQRAILDLLANVTILKSRRGRPPGARRNGKGFGSYFDPNSIDIAWK
jgi:hypothetical protein